MAVIDTNHYVVLVGAQQSEAVHYAGQTLVATDRVFLEWLERSQLWAISCKVS